MSQHTVNLSCVADADIDVRNPTINYGGATTIRINAGASNSPISSSFLKFQSSYAHKKTISAKLNLYRTAGSGFYGQIARLLTVFDESTITANNLPTSEAFSRITIGSGSSTGWIFPIEIKDYLEYAVLNGLCLSYYGISDSSTFSSKEGANDPYIEYTYEDSPPLAPIPLTPSNEFIANNAIIRFDWQYRAEFGGVQKSYTFEWKLKTDSVYTVITATSANNYVDVPANTFPNGNIDWRVKTTNEYDEASPYSDVLSFYSIGKPTAPTVYASNSPRPTVTWSASNQQMYQLQLLSGSTVIHDTGNMPAAFSYQIPRYLADGSYTAQVRIRNAYGLWSDYGTYVFTVATSKPTTPTLSIAANYKTGLKLLLGYVTPKAIVYRRLLGIGSYVSIAETTATEYTDYTCASGVRYEYFVRAVAANNTFSDGAAVSGSITLTCTAIANADDPSNALLLRYRLSSGLGRTQTNSTGKYAVKYVGRELPVSEKTGFKDRTITLNYFIKAAQLDAVDALQDGDVLYRNESGLLMYGTIDSFQYAEQFRGNNRGYDVSFTIRAINREEDGELA